MRLACLLRLLGRATGPPAALGLPARPSEGGEALITAGMNTYRREMISLTAVWVEMGQWRKTAAQYASSVACWGLCCRSCDKGGAVAPPATRVPAARARRAAGVEPWPPSGPALEVLITVCRSAATLSQYASRIRSVLRLLRAPAGVLDAMGGIVKGAQKCEDRAVRRYRARASAEQTRELAAWVRRETGRDDVADSFLVARQARACRGGRAWFLPVGALRALGNSA